MIIYEIKRYYEFKMSILLGKGHFYLKITRQLISYITKLNSNKDCSFHF